MTKAEALKTLENHQHWRLCKDDECDCVMGKPTDITQALDELLRVSKKALDSQKTKAVKK